MRAHQILKPLVSYKNTAYLGILVLPLLALFSACDTDFLSFPDGKIPQEFLQDAQRLEGSYEGRFANKESKLEIRIINFMPEFHLFLNNEEDCTGAFGKLLYAHIPRDTGKISHVTLTFNPEKCLFLEHEYRSSLWRFRNFSITLKNPVASPQHFGSLSSGSPEKIELKIERFKENARTNIGEPTPIIFQFLKLPAKPHP